MVTAIEVVTLRIPKTSLRFRDNHPYYEDWALVDARRLKRQERRYTARLRMPRPKLLA
jgi:hypothetical protein